MDSVTALADVDNGVTGPSVDLRYFRFWIGFGFWLRFWLRFRLGICCRLRLGFRVLFRLLLWFRVGNRFRVRIFCRFWSWRNVLFSAFILLLDLGRRFIRFICVILIRDCRAAPDEQDNQQDGLGDFHWSILRPELL